MADHEHAFAAEVQPIGVAETTAGLEQEVVLAEPQRRERADERLSLIHI